MYSIHNTTTAAENMVGLPMTDVEREVILATLRRTEGNRTHAARSLGMSLRTLRNKISQYGAEGFDIPKSDPIYAARN